MRLLNKIALITGGSQGIGRAIAAALFMASDDSTYMTGHCMVVDGGQLIKLS